MNKAHWPSHNLRDLVSFLSLQYPGGISLSSVSEKLGVSAQAVSAILVKDDCYLSWVEKLAVRFGYTLRLKYVIPVPMGISKGNKASEVFPNAGNLAGLAEYATTYNMTINALANKLNLNYRVVKRALKEGKIKLSTLNEILRSLDIKVMWVWVENNLSE